jgi:tetratricopeptide (TPR) repeat protein
VDPGLRKEAANVAKVELALATIDRQNKNYEAAETRYRHVLAIWTKVNGPNSTNVAFGLNNLGNNYLEQGDEKRAEAKYREALAIFESRLGKSHPNVAMTLANLGRCLVGQGRHQEAIPLLRRVIEIDQKTSGPRSADTGWDRLFLAQALWRKDRAGAREEAKAGLAILDREVGREHPELKKWLEENPELREP